MRYLVAIDAGGTFTDVSFVDIKERRLRNLKVLSRPDDPAAAVLNGVELILGWQDTVTPQVLRHGTTLATNAVLERRGGRAVLFTTKGFGDVLEIARQTRPSIYDLRQRRPDALVPRRSVIEVEERVLASGEILQSVDPGLVNTVASRMPSEGVEAAAVCFLHSYANPANERTIRDALLASSDGIFVCISSDLVPRFGEYERANTTVVNAYLMPVMKRYTRRLHTLLVGKYPQLAVQIMQSNGGIMGPDAAADKPVHAILSGPAAGVIAGAAVARVGGWPNAILLDMGGTSTDISMVLDAEPRQRTESRIVAGQSLSIPTLDIETIGAGGGSIARVDIGKALLVGPESAGASPGPVCYGRGGDRLTVTDANAVLGRIGAGEFGSGEISLRPDLALEQFEKSLSKDLAISPQLAAQGVISVVNSNMARGVRRVSVERGINPRECVLVAFGGAGPLHASSLARELEIPTVVVPLAPGFLSSLGLLVATIRFDFIQTYISTIQALDPWRMRTIIRTLSELARGAMAREGVAEADSVLEYSADLRYKGQGYELTVGFPPSSLDNGLGGVLAAGFNALHFREYGFARSEETIEIVNLRTNIRERRPVMHWPDVIEMYQSTALRRLSGPYTERAVLFDSGQTTTPVWKRQSLQPGIEIEGPLVIEDTGSTILALPGQTVSVDNYYNILIQGG